MIIEDKSLVDALAQAIQQLSPIPAFLSCLDQLRRRGHTANCPALIVLPRLCLF
jgi:hypothetical protein